MHEVSTGASITIAKHCHGCQIELTNEVDSAAHIIPNALGGRIAPRGIICQKCNGVLDRVADNPLLQTFAQWPTLLNIPRQRGSHPPVIVEDTAGNKFRVTDNGSRTIARPEYLEESTEEGHKVDISAPTVKQAKQLIQRAAKQFPQLDPTEAEKHAHTVSQVPEQEWRVRMNFAPDVCFPGIMSALWLFHIYKTNESFLPWNDLQSKIDQQKLTKTLRYMPDGFPGLYGPHTGPSHKLIVKSVGESPHLLFGYVEILSVLRIGGVLCENYDKDIEEIYVADPFSKTELSDQFFIDKDAVSSIDWANAGLPFDPATARDQLLPRLLDSASILQTAWQQREAEMSADDKEDPQD